MLKEFKEFVMRGNVMDMAVGIVIGAAFGTIVKSLVSDVIMPPIGLLLGGVDFSNLFMVVKEGATAGPYASLADAQAAGAVSVNYGLFINTPHQLPDRRGCDLRGSEGGQPHEAGRGSAAGRSDHQKLRPLRHRDPDQGDPLSQLHIRTRHWVRRSPAVAGIC